MLVDTHCHLMDDRFAVDIEAVIERADRAGIGAFVCVGYDLDSSRAAIALAERFARVYAAVGIHPNATATAPACAMSALAAMTDHPRVVAVGETGLDNYRHRSPPATQRRWLDAHIALAARSNLPLIIHNREADDEFARILPQSLAGLPAGGVMHCFSGTESLMHATVTAGFMVSFAGPVTFRSATDLQRIATITPLDNMVVETDCPYLAPVPHRGKRNEPAYVRFTARMIADLRGVDEHELAATTSRNALRLFARIDRGKMGFA
jgi:TatD DNase family protein